jgi:hypothetical protein
MSRYRVRLAGGRAQLGEVDAGDVAHLVTGLQRVVARAAGASIGRQVTGLGRWGRLPEEVTRFRLDGVGPPGVTLDLSLPADDDAADQLALGDLRLGDRAWDLAMAAVTGERRDDRPVLEYLARLADDLKLGARYQAIELSREGRTGEARLDPAGRARIEEAVVRLRRVEAGRVAGTLVEADFERCVARVRTDDGEQVAVRFEPELADEVYEALRRPTELDGQVELDLTAGRVTAIQVTTISRPAQAQLTLPDP